MADSSCEIHKDKAVNFYCQSHDQVICDLCYKYLDHTSCTDVIDIDEACSKGTWGQLADGYLAEIQDLITKFQKLQNLAELRRQRKECCNDIKAFRKKVNKALDKLERNTYEQTFNTEKNYAEHVTSLRTTTEESIKVLRKSVASLQSAESPRQDKHMFIAVKKARHEKMKAVYYNIEQELHMEKFKFEPDKQLLDTVEQLKQLGQLTVERQRSTSQSTNPVRVQQGQHYFGRQIEHNTNEIAREGNGKDLLDTQTSEDIPGSQSNTSTRVQSVKHSIHHMKDDGTEYPFNKMLSSVKAKDFSSQQMKNIEAVQAAQFDVRVQPDDIKKCDITGSVFLEDGSLLLTDYSNDNLKLLSRGKRSCIKLPSVPWDVAVVNQEEVVVSLPWEKKLQFVRVGPKLELTTIVDMGRQCWGIACKNNKLYIACLDQGNIAVLVLDQHGQGKETIIRTSEEGQYGDYMYIVVDNKGRLYISVNIEHFVLCITPEGQTVYKYSDEELGYPRCLLVDGDSNVFVCGHTNNVQVISRDGMKDRTLVQEEEGQLQWAQTMAYRDTDRILVIGMIGNNMIVFTLQ